MESAKLQKFSDWCLDLIFPVRCVGCGDFSESYICKACLSLIPVRYNFSCIGCKQPAVIGETCGGCRGDGYVVDRLLVASDYKNKLVESAVKYFKYRFISDMRYPLFIIMARYIKKLHKDKNNNVFDGNPLIVPVPLHYRRENWRGFNQSSLLAEMLALSYQQNLCPALVRQAISKPQAEISERSERLKNVSGLFDLNSGTNVAGRRILLIDDVCTTGATLNECAKVLKAGGAREVTALVVARG